MIIAILRRSYRHFLFYVTQTITRKLKTTEPPPKQFISVFLLFCFSSIWDHFFRDISQQSKPITLSFCYCFFATISLWLFLTQTKYSCLWFRSLVCAALRINWQPLFGLYLLFSFAETRDGVGFLPIISLLRATLAELFDFIETH